MTKSFEEFEVYKKSILLTKEIFTLLLKPGLENEFVFKNQIKRATFSITNNIAEGSEYNNNKQFVRFLKYLKEVVVKSETCLSYQKNSDLQAKMRLEKFII